MTNRSAGVLVLSILLAGFLVLGALPNQVASIRLAGLSLLWWYGGALAPAAGVLVAFRWPTGARSRSPADG